MKNIILNEKEMLDDILNNGAIDQKKPSRTLGLLIRHYILQGKDKDEIYKLCDKFMEDNFDNYIKTKWTSFIKEMINSISGFKRLHNIVNVDKIVIMEEEWEAICKLNDKKLEKIAFITLVYKKCLDIKAEGDDCWVNVDMLDILQEALNRRKQDEKILFGLLTKLGYIETGRACDTKGFKITYCYNEGIPKFIIDDFDKVIHYYNQYRFNWKYIKCTNIKEDGKPCNTWEKISKHASIDNTKYCKKCANKIRNKKIAEINRRNRNK